MYLELMEHFNLGQVNVKTKVADRIVVVTTSSIIKLDNKYKVMKTISLEKVSHPSQEGCSIMLRDWTLGTLRNHDVDGNGNVKKQ